MLPAPQYTLISTSLDSEPAIVVVNAALRGYTDRASFPWHLRVTITMRHARDNGMPDDDELPEIEREEDRISEALLAGENALFHARVTTGGHRDLTFRVRDPEAADNALQRLIAEDTQTREWEYRMEQDIEWALAEPELRLLESDPRFN